MQAIHSEHPELRLWRVIGEPRKAKSPVHARNVWARSRGRAIATAQAQISTPGLLWFAYPISLNQMTEI